MSDRTTKYVDGLGWKGHAYSHSEIDVRRLDFVSIYDLAAFIAMRLTNRKSHAVNIEMIAIGEIGPRYMWPGKFSGGVFSRIPPDGEREIIFATLVDFNEED